MPKDLNAVKIGRSRKRVGAVTKESKPYHHGALREELIRAAVEIVEEAGPDGFSLRAAARRAGVSAAAPAHHFGDVRGLLTAVATVGFREFADELEAVSDRQATVIAVARVYLRFAQKRPGMFRLMWRTSAFHLTDEGLYQAGLRAFRVLDQAVRGKATSELVGDLSLAPTIAAWSMMHGFSALAIDQAFFADDPAELAQLEVLLDAVFSNLDIAKKAASPAPTRKR
ncbi:MAG TPA: TetR/AcrR family transcriptional regulator [Steroidobacter sp.]|uniref:TetR/AcrR family transcriptional regulator n=1 Tax=Steroidobacter sp. TaxID=1978227 RepID=UPI002EDB9648